MRIRKSLKLEKRFSILNNTTIYNFKKGRSVVGNLQVTHEPRTLFVDMVQVDYPLKVREWRHISRQLKVNHPEMTHVSGMRVTGRAAQKSGLSHRATRPLPQLPKTIAKIRVKKR